MAKGKMANPGKVTRKTSSPTATGGKVVAMAGSKPTKTANNTANRKSTPQKAGKS